MEIESALGFAVILLSRVQVLIPTLWPAREPESLRSPSCELALYKNQSKPLRVTGLTIEPSCLDQNGCLKISTNPRGFPPYTFQKFVRASGGIMVSTFAEKIARIFVSSVEFSLNLSTKEIRATAVLNKVFREQILHY
ncbi:hypothetical protein PoB_005051800 [Plakobranchus ocellatus]|uniref:Uncharacterized protein n=1 Tax=Plakobranchus ocellatus TaxID=259542 RepID=A0AAV4BYY8_9GAST|nr:hypothetical protein PoB_005051800 [Plakobranchus ocellatus]